MSKGDAIAALFHPRQRYVRATHLERDFNDVAALREYVVSKQSQYVLERLVDGLGRNSQQRAWRLTGDYGSGKSSLALALAHVVSRKTKELPVQLRSFSKRKPSGFGKVGMLPVLLTGSREPLASALLNRMIEAVGESGKRRSDPKFVGRARKALENQNPENLDGQVIQLLEDLMAYLRKTRRAAGLCLVIDELGKFLEYAARDPERQDVYLLQQIAELAARSGDFPLLVLGVLHQGFSAYAARSSVTQQKEWEKVAGRYEEIVFQPSLEQSMFLAGSALGVTTAALAQKTRKQHASDLKSAIQLGWYGSAASDVSADLALQVYPVHPSAFPVLARLFQRFGQNERSLLGFLLLGEPFGLQEFAAETTDLASLYRIHNIYDYIKANFGYRLQHEPGSRWSLLESLVDAYVPQESEDERLVLKTVAVLNLLDSQGLLATDKALLLGLPGKQTRVKRAIEVLTAERRILYARGPSGGYCLWPHTSVDLLDCHARATGALGPIERIAPYAKNALENRPIVARRHYIWTGSLRYFGVHHVAADDLRETLDTLDTESDGHIVVALCENTEERQSAIEIARSRVAPGERPDRVLIAASPSLQPLASLFQDVRCWEWVRTNVFELGQDRLAAQEVSRLIEEARHRLHVTVNDLLGLRQGPKSRSIEWYRAGELQDVEGGRGFLSLLSDICDEVYVEGPQVHNELINRAQLSSAAAAARMRLIERIFEHPNEPFLGLDPERKPPEMSVYLSVLHHAKLHRQNRQKDWHFALPSLTSDVCNLRPALLCITKVLREAKEKRVPLSTIMLALREPPYGVRDGLILLFIAVVCAIDEQRIALYEEGSFVRKISGEHFARILKFPNNYELQYFTISGVRSVLFHQLLRMLVPDGELDGAVNILDVVRPLLEFVGQLPQHTLRTHRLTPETQAVRQVLLTAREPAPLLFEELPTACGLKPFSAQRSAQVTAKARIERFSRALRTSIEELRAAYPDLLARMRGQVVSAFDMGLDFLQTRERLGRRAERSLTTVREPRLRGFCLRLADRVLAEQPWLESLGSYICAKPPSIWLDGDADRFADELVLLVERFMRAESLAFGTHDDETSDRSVRVSLTRADGTHVDQVITMTATEQAHVAELEDKIAELLSSEQRRVGLAAISRTLWRKLQLTSDGEITHTGDGSGS